MSEAEIGELFNSLWNDKDRLQSEMAEAVSDRPLAVTAALFNGRVIADKDGNEQTIDKETADAVISIIDSVYDPKAMLPEDARSNNVELKVDESKLAMPQFKALWERINSKSVYTVNFDTDELVEKSIDVLNRKLRVSPIFFKVESGQMESIESKESLLS